MVINQAKQQRNYNLEKEKQKHREEAEKEAMNALADASYAPGLSRSPGASRLGTSTFKCKAKRGKQKSEGATDGTGQPAPLPTPPQSPTTFSLTVSHSDGLDQCSTDRRENEVNKLQNEINTLQSQLDKKATECHRLRTERRQASRIHHGSIHRDDEEEIATLKKRVERLDELLKQAEENTEGLQ